MAARGRPRDPNSATSRIEAFVNGRASTTAAEVAAAFPDANAPSTILGSLERSGRIQRNGRGAYGPVTK
jgi:hypothetical protein